MHICIYIYISTNTSIYHLSHTLRKASMKNDLPGSWPKLVRLDIHAVSGAASEDAKSKRAGLSQLHPSKKSSVMRRVNPQARYACASQRKLEYLPGLAIVFLRLR